MNAEDERRGAAEGAEEEEATMGACRPATTGRACLPPHREAVGALLPTAKEVAIFAAVVWLVGWWRDATRVGVAVGHGGRGSTPSCRGPVRGAGRWRKAPLRAATQQLWPRTRGDQHTARRSSVMRGEDHSMQKVGLLG